MMSSENLPTSHITKVASKLKFIFEIKNQNLSIEASNTDDKTSYIGEIPANPMVDFDYIKQMLQSGEYKTLIKNQDTLKIKIGPIQLQMSQKSKLTLKDYEDKIKKFLEQKTLYEQTIDSQKEQIANLKKKLEFCYQKTLNIPFVSPVIKTKWSQELKGTNLKINGSSIQNISTNSQNNGQFGLLQMGFSRVSDTKQCWAIKIKKSSGFVSLGICLKNFVQAKSFLSKNFNWEKTGHGCYLIENNLIYSHSQEKFNAKQLQKPLIEFGQYYDPYINSAFNTEDIVYCEYNAIKCVITWMVNDGPEKFQMPIVPPPKNDAYHPCVRLYKGSSVELISQN